MSLCPRRVENKGLKQSDFGLDGTPPRRSERSGRRAGRRSPRSPPTPARAPRPGRRSSDNLHPSREALVVAMEVRDAVLGVLPAVVAFAVVEVHEPQPFRLEVELLDLRRPAAHHLA